MNPIMKEVVKKEIIKWLDAGIIYPISDSSWVSPVQCVPKNGGITVVANENNELIPTRTVTGWRICLDYRKLNKATRKDHFPLPFIDQMLDRLAGKKLWKWGSEEQDTFDEPKGQFTSSPTVHLIANSSPHRQSSRCRTLIYQQESR